jgi:hypothetical protein
MKTQSALLLFQYWNRLRGGTPAPARTQIEPADIRDVLSQTFILESERHNSNMLFRLAGTAITNLFGRALRGVPIRSLFQDQHKPIIHRLLRNCYQEGSVVLLSFDAKSRSRRQTLLEIMLLPLQDEAEGHRVLGCIAPHQYQFWHGLEPLVQLELHSIRLVDPDREPLFLANRPEITVPPSLEPDEHEFDPGKSVQTGVQLLVIDGGKSTTNKSTVTKH